MANTENYQEPKTKQSETVKRNDFRMVFFALLESAMRYREATWREDVEEIEQESIRGAEGYKQSMALLGTPVDKGFDKRVEKKIKATTVDFHDKQVKFNKIAYQTIKDMETRLTAKSKIAFDNYATAFGLMAEELVAAKNTTEILTICKLYNAGVMDGYFSQIRNELSANQSETPVEEVISDGDHLKIQRDNVGGPVAEQVSEELNQKYEQVDLTELNKGDEKLEQI